MTKEDELNAKLDEWGKKLTPEEITELIEDSVLNDAQKAEMRALFEKAGNTPAFWEKFTAISVAGLEAMKTGMLADFQKIDEGTAAIRAKAEDEEIRLGDELQQRIKTIDPWDIDKIRAEYGEYAKKTQAVQAASGKELGTFAAKIIID